MAGGIAVVFDFDKTIIDVDSDNWVVDSLGSTELFERLNPTMPWNSLMDLMMKEVHSQGRKTIDDIAECLKRAPLDPRVISAIKSAHALGCDLRVVSDANLFFIETILKHHEILECFSEINTNPSHVDDDGRLRIFPCHHFTLATTSHGCSLCPPNMCKGKIIERIMKECLEEGREKKQLIYLGDGKGDYCPSLRLREGDFVMPRKGYPVWDLITANIHLIKAEVHGWTDAEEEERVLLKLIRRSISAAREDSSIISSRLLLTDCHVQTVPTEAQIATYRRSPLKPFPSRCPFDISRYLNLRTP